MSEITFNLIVDPKHGFYQMNDNGIKCEFMELEGYFMLCNRDIGVFKKGVTYLIHSNSNEQVIYEDNVAKEFALTEEKELDEYDLLYGFLEQVPVERFEDGTFTLITKLFSRNKNE